MGGEKASRRQQTGCSTMEDSRGSGGDGAGRNGIQLISTVSGGSGCLFASSVFSSFCRCWHLFLAGPFRLQVMLVGRGRFEGSMPLLFFDLCSDCFQVRCFLVFPASVVDELRNEGFGGGPGCRMPRRWMLEIGLSSRAMLVMY